MNCILILLLLCCGNNGNGCRNSRSGSREGLGDRGAGCSSNAANNTCGCDNEEAGNRREGRGERRCESACQNTCEELREELCDRKPECQERERISPPIRSEFQSYDNVY